MKNKLKSEEELANIIIKHFEKEGWSSYNEVSKSGGGSDRADLYLLKGDETFSIETKLTWGIKVLEQALSWRGWSSHGAYIAIPKPGYKKIRFIVNLCRELNLGLIFVSDIVEVKTIPGIKKQTHKPWLHEEQKSSIAGNNKSQYVTPFSITRDNWYKLFEKNREVILDDLLNMPNHYKSKASAKGSIIKLVKQGAVNFTIKDNICIWKG